MHNTSIYKNLKFPLAKKITQKQNLTVHCKHGVNGKSRINCFYDSGGEKKERETVRKINGSVFGKTRKKMASIFLSSHIFSHMSA